MIQIICFIFLCTLSYSQSKFFAVASEYDDSAVSWYLYAEDDDYNEIQSSVRAKWPLKNTWTEWQFDHLDYYWDMYLRYQTNPQHWFLDTYNTKISIKQKWRNDLTEWTISYDKHRLKWTTEYGRDVSYWYFEDKELGFMQMWTTYDGDARDWEVEDEAPDVPDEVKMAMILITIIVTNGGV